MNSLILKIFLRLVIYGLLIFVSLSLYFLYVYIRPARYISAFTPLDLGLDYEDITLKTKDGIKLAAWFIPQRNSRKAVIVCHGYPADKGNVLGIAAFLAPHYNLLFFDFRALGKSQGRFSTGGWKEREDFLAAVRFLKERGFSDIGAYGFSMGGAVILMANSPDIKAIVSDSAYKDLNAVLNLIFQNFGILRYPFVWLAKLWTRVFFKMDVDKVSPLKYISQIKAPIFLIHSQQDSQIPLEHAQLLHRANHKSLLWIIPDADHGQGLALRQQDYQEKVLNFFKENL
jgi:dipeptidyl aminopeptidase/acylaminoacyl peptidase